MGALYTTIVPGAQAAGDSGQTASTAEDAGQAIYNRTCITCHGANLEGVPQRGPSLIGVGEAATPTPRGTYFITALFRLIDPYGPYGPYAFGLSGFSNVLRSFGGGPGQLAIHGTNDPGGIGSNVSHGCIHVSNPEITRLSKELPLGTPVQIAS